MILEKLITIHTIFYYAIHHITTHYTHTTHILHTYYTHTTHYNLTPFSWRLCCKWSIDWKRKNPTFCRIQIKIQILTTKKTGVTCLDFDPPPLSRKALGPNESHRKNHRRVIEKNRKISSDYFLKSHRNGRYLLLLIREYTLSPDPMKKLNQPKFSRQNPKKMSRDSFFYSRFYFCVFLL